ncbi:MAG: hypothetical protein LBH31_02455 [Burkholderiaceae bacterium]|jgi:hypothetical protein|nr:hypothetical protein [Burkholderiaceae bacterium]
MAWRDALLRLIPPVTIRQAQTRLRSSNTSGVPGVSLVKSKSGRNQLVGWRATLNTPERNYGTTFSFKTYGQRAKELAIAERQRLLDQYGIKAFAMVNAQAMQDATQRFGHLLDNPQPVDITPAQSRARVNALNNWFDQLQPERLYICLKVYFHNIRGINTPMAYVRVTFIGAQNREIKKACPWQRADTRSACPNCGGSFRRLSPPGMARSAGKRLRRAVGMLSWPAPHKPAFRVATTARRRAIRSAANRPRRCCRCSMDLNSRNYLTRNKRVPAACCRNAT